MRAAGLDNLGSRETSINGGYKMDQESHQWTEAVGSVKGPLHGKASRHAHDDRRSHLWALSRQHNTLCARIASLQTVIDGRIRSPQQRRRLQWQELRGPVRTAGVQRLSMNKRPGHILPQQWGAQIFQCGFD